MKKQQCPRRRNRYYNPHINDIRRRAVDAVYWKTGIYKDPIGYTKAPEGFSYPTPEEKLDMSKPMVKWVGHNTFLISIHGINILTDPVWSERCSPFSFFGPKRRHDPGISLDQLPEIHFVMISHNHYDHLDRKTVKALLKRFPNISWLIPKGLRRWFQRLGAKNLLELQWWEEVNIKVNEEINIKATAVPTQHFSGRHFLNLNKTLWVGWVLDITKEKEHKRMYYVGDTGYNPHDFKNIGNHFGHMDLSLIPIGTYIPRIFMSPVHIEPHDSVNIHKEVGSKLSVSMHWKTFNLADEPQEQPPYDLYLRLTTEGIDPHTFRVLDPGQAINW